MQIIDNNVIKEKIYTETLENRLKVIILPQKTNKKYIVWSANFGSIDNKFYSIENDELITVPDGIAHYLEHKLFEQKNGRNSLDVLSSLGVNANAYTTNDHTAYLYECTENFDVALDEFMDYVQNPYFTDENVEKERGIIGQEIMMYKDYPEWEIYMNALKCMYKNNEMNIDVAGSKESIAKITPETLYTIYNTFYSPENMVMVLVGDFVPEEVIQKIKARMTLKKREKEIKREYNEEPKEIVEKYIEEEMDISIPVVIIGYKDNNINPKDVRKDIALQIIGDILFGNSSDLYENLYGRGMLINPPSFHFEFSKTFSHVLIQMQTEYVEDVVKASSEQIQKFLKTGFDISAFERSKRKVYGDIIKDFNDVSEIATTIVSDYFKGISPFDYLENFNTINKEYVEEVFRNIFVEDMKVISVIKPISHSKE